MLHRVRVHHLKTSETAQLTANSHRPFTLMKAEKSQLSPSTQHSYGSFTGQMITGGVDRLGSPVAFDEAISVHTQEAVALKLPHL